MAKKRFLLLTLTIASMFGVTIGIFSSLAPTFKEANAITNKNDQEKILPGETELDQATDPLKVEIVDTTTTEHGASFDLKFSTGEKAIRDIDGIYNIIDESGELIEADKRISDMDKDTERKEYYEKLQKGEIETTVISDCFIYSFVNKNVRDITIPRTVYRGEGEEDEVYYYYGVISALGSYVIKDNNYVRRLYIPNTIDTIPADAFLDNSTLETIYCEIDSKPIGWADGWNNNIPVTWGYDVYDEFTTRADYENVSFARQEDVGNKEINYIIGNFPQDGESQPLVVEYKLEGSSTKYYAALDRKSKATIYDGVGYLIYGYVNRLTVVLDLNKGEKLDFDSIVVHNILRASRSSSSTGPQYLPDLTKPMYIAPDKMFTKIYDLGEFINITFDGVSTFGDYISIGTKVDIVNGGRIFETLRPGQYSNYENKIKSGKAYIRMRFTSLPIASYRVKSNGVETVSQVVTPITQIILTKNSGNRVNFMLHKSNFSNGFDLNSFEYFALENLTISLDVVDNSVIIKRTVAHTKFGCVYFYTPEDTLKTFDGTLFIVLLTLGYIIAAALVSTGLFFFMKVKYKNDEFRRIKPKTFIKKAVIYSLTSLAVVLFIAFVILRTTALLSSIIVYNPLDLFITLFGIATIIIIGYYVKEIVVATKAKNLRKKNKKLGILNDTVDDGTK